VVRQSVRRFSRSRYFVTPRSGMRVAGTALPVQAETLLCRRAGASAHMALISGQRSDMARVRKKADAPWCSAVRATDGHGVGTGAP